MANKMYLVEMPGDWAGDHCGFCCECPLLARVRRLAKNNRAECPLASARETVEVNGMLALQKGKPPMLDGKPVRLFSVEEK